LERTKTYNPKLNAYITVMERQSLAQAARLDLEAKAGSSRGRLHGIPIGIKDNIDTVGVRTTGASAVFDDRVATEDAEVTRRLKEAGAVLIGKTNLHEFAIGALRLPPILVQFAIHGHWTMFQPVLPAGRVQLLPAICASERSVPIPAGQSVCRQPIAVSWD
jgi:hypothetical protein